MGLNVTTRFMELKAQKIADITTLTLFWMRIVRGYLAEESRNRSIVHLANGLIAKYADRHLPFRYYTRDRLMSAEARINWVEPDLRAIDSKIVAIGAKY